MKNKISFLISFFVVFAVMLSCKKNGLLSTDTPPEFAQLDTAFLGKGEGNKDPGAPAFDKEDGDLSQLVSSDWAQKVQPLTVGFYTVTYQVTDLDDNSAFQKRIVSVQYRAPFPTGKYLLNLGKRVQNYGLDSVSTTCILSAGGQSDVFTGRYLQNNYDMELRFIPQDNTLNMVYVFIDNLAGLCKVSQDGKLIEFKCSGFKRINSLNYPVTVVGVLTKLP